MWDVLQDNWMLFLVGQYPRGPMGGLVATLALAVLGLGLAFPCGLVLALGRVSARAPIRMISAVIVRTMRGIPFLMVIFWSYFFIPKLTGHPISGFVTMVGALIVYESTYMAEVIRAGIQSIPAGQIDAARSLGLKHRSTMTRIVLPQALYNVLPSLVSQTVAATKETSLGYVISVQEVTFAAQQVNSMLLTKPVQVFGILALTFFVLCFALTQTARFIERRIARRRVRYSGGSAPGAGMPDTLAGQPVA